MRPGNGSLSVRAGGGASHIDDGRGARRPAEGRVRRNGAPDGSMTSDYLVQPAFLREGTSMSHEISRGLHLSTQRRSRCSPAIQAARSMACGFRDVPVRTTEIVK